MNRRGFVQRTMGALVAAACAPWLKGVVQHAGTKDLLTFRGARLVFDATCPRNRVYFVNPQAFWYTAGNLIVENPRQLGVITEIDSD